MPGALEAAQARDFFKREITVVHQPAGEFNFYGILEFDDGMTRAFLEEPGETSHTRTADGSQFLKTGILSRVGNDVILNFVHRGIEVCPVVKIDSLLAV